MIKDTLLICSLILCFVLLYRIYVVSQKINTLEEKFTILDNFSQTLFTYIAARDDKQEDEDKKEDMITYSNESNKNEESEDDENKEVYRPTKNKNNERLTDNFESKEIMSEMVSQLKESLLTMANSGRQDNNENNNENIIAQNEEEKELLLQMQNIQKIQQIQQMEQMRQMNLLQQQIQNNQSINITEDKVNETEVNEQTDAEVNESEVNANVENEAEGGVNETEASSMNNVKIEQIEETEENKESDIYNLLNNVAIKKMEIVESKKDVKKLKKKEEELLNMKMADLKELAKQKNISLSQSNKPKKKETLVKELLNHL